MNNYLNLPIEEINKLLKQKKIKPIDLVNEFYDKINELNLSSYIYETKDYAIKQALKLENNEVDNLLFGLPIVINDNIVTKDLKTTASSKTLDTFIPVYDATVINAVKNKNMIIVGKTKIDEFGLPIGNKNGGIKLVSNGIVPFSLGSHIGAKTSKLLCLNKAIIMKPTYGRVSRYGLISLAGSLEQIGPVTRTISENALLLKEISGFDPNDTTTFKNNLLCEFNVENKIKNKKIAILNNNLNSENNQFNKMIKMLQEHNFNVEYIDIPILKHVDIVHKIIMYVEASSNLSRFDGIRFGYSSPKFTNIDELYINTRTEAFGRDIKKAILKGTYILTGNNINDYYYKAIILKNEITKTMGKLFKEFDYFINPINLDDKQEELLNLGNITGNPALYMPIFKNKVLSGGIQIISAYYNEQEIYQLANYIECNLRSGK